MYKLGKRSWERLHGVHPDLVYIVSNAIKISEVDFTVLEGVRSKQRQVSLVESGASKTLNSRHITGHAVDLGAIIDGRVAWDWPLYHKIAEAMFQIAKCAGRHNRIHSNGGEGEPFSVIEWGGHWSKFRDGPHFQLPWEEYPK